MPLVKMKHDVDPKQVIIDKMKPYLDGIEVMGEDVLLGVYMQPEITAGGIHLVHEVRKENEFQGLACVVLKKGPLAFVEDENHHYGPRVPQVGDWVAVRKSEGFSFKTGPSHEKAQPCRLMNEKGIRLIISDPDSVW
jgi:hypothetical protein